MKTRVSSYAPTATVGLAVAVLLSSCTGSGGGAPTTSASVSTTTSTGTSTPATSTTSADTVQDQAGQAVVRMGKVRSELYADPAASLDKLETVARGQALAQLRSDVSAARAENLVLVGASKLTPVKVTLNRPRFFAAPMRVAALG